MAQPTSGMQYIDKPLGNISVAYQQDASAFIADKVFPLVATDKSGKFYIYNKADFFSDEMEEREQDSESGGTGYRLSTGNYACVQYAIHKSVTQEDKDEADSVLNAVTDATEFVTEKMLIGREVKFVNAFFTSGIWGTDIDGVASSPSTGEVLQWDVTASTPIADISDGVFAMQMNTGKAPNILILGALAYKALKNHAGLLERIKYTTKEVITPDLLANLLDVPKVMVAFAIKNTAGKNADASMAYIFGKHALLAYVAPKAGKKVASAGYIFVNKHFKGTAGLGTRINRIPTPLLGIGSERIEIEAQYVMKVIATDMGYFFNGIVS